jgi:hypothetical protein
MLSDEDLAEANVNTDYLWLIQNVPANIIPGLATLGQAYNQRVYHSCLI